MLDVCDFESHLRRKEQGRHFFEASHSLADGVHAGFSRPISVFVLNLNSPRLDNAFRTVIVPVFTTIAVIPTASGRLFCAQIISDNQSLHSPLVFSVEAGVILATWPGAIGRKVAR
jgi:hypothetical protein